MSALDRLDPRYSVLLCDIWGCIHDGVQLYPGADRRLQQFKEEGRCVILITNAPRTAEAVEAQLTRLGLPRDAYDHVTTSGESGISALLALGRPVGFIGTAADRAILEGRGVEIAETGFSEVAVTGLDDQRGQPGDYREQLRRLAGAGVEFHCLNPDRLVVRGGVPEACAGALADIYREMGGQVVYYGKPHPAIYRHALKLASNPLPDTVLAIGDALHTDMLGAARMGFDCVFVAGGIHSGEDVPADFGPANGLGDWRPVAVVEALG